MDERTPTVDRRRSVPSPRRPRSGTVPTVRPAPPEGQVPPDVRPLLAWATYDATPTLVAEGTGDGPVLTWANRAAAVLLGCAEQDLAGRPLLRLQRSPLVPRAAHLADDGALHLHPLRGTERVTRVQRDDGSAVRVRLSSTPTGTEEHPQWVLRLRGDDAVDRHRAEEDLRASQERFRAVADQAPVGIFSSERGMRLAYVNERFSRLLGTASERLLGTDWLALLHPEDVEPAVTALRTVLEGTAVELPLRVGAEGAERTLHARVVPVRHGRDTGFLGTVEDVTERLAFEQLLAHQARHDPLTGLRNRRALLERTAQELAAGRPLALMLLDLDDFKLVNDTHGHDTGDALLSAVGARLAGAVRDGDVVARFGGDEFAVLCLDVEDEADARRLAGRLLAHVTGPLRLGAGAWTVAGSLGVALGRTGATPEDLLRDADTAMYQAKAAGKGTWALFDEQARDEAVARQALVEDLRAALRDGGLTLAYQPLVSVGGTGEPRLIGVEALARWTHPVRGNVPPLEFVALAEQHGLVRSLGRAVLREACAQLVRWDDELGDAAPETVAVNVSALAAAGRGVRRRRSRRRCATPASHAARLCLELTESAVLSDSGAAARTLAALRALGVRIALDDFGTGYSSLAAAARAAGRPAQDRPLVPAGPRPDRVGRRGRRRRRAGRGARARGGGRGRRDASSSWPSCAGWAAPSRRATCSAGRWRPTPSRLWVRGRA